MVSASSALVLTLAVTPALLAAQSSPADSARAPFEGMLSFIGQGSAISGGITAGSVGLGVFSAQGTLHLGPLLHWRGATVYASVMATFGGHADRYTGDVQGVSNIDGPSGVRIEEAWLQQNLLDERLSLLAGVYDVSAEFYRLQSATLFINSSFGTGAEFAGSGVAGPSIFPFTSLGGRIGLNPSGNVVIRFALLDAVPLERIGVDEHFPDGNGVLLLGEVAWLRRPADVSINRQRRYRIGRGQHRPYSGKLALGGWYYTGTFDRIVPGGAPAVQVQGSGGVYLITDQTLNPGSAGRRGPLTGFLELGLGDGRVNQVGGYVGAGLMLTGPLPRRAEDQLGLAVAAAINGEAFGDLPGTSTGETAIELTWLAQLTPWLAAQPDIQYVIDPGGIEGARNAWVFSLVVALSY